MGPPLNVRAAPWQQQCALLAANAWLQPPAPRSARLGSVLMGLAPVDQEALKIARRLPDFDPRMK